MEAGSGETVVAVVEAGSGESVGAVVEEEDSDGNAGVDAEAGGTLRDGVESVTRTVGIHKMPAYSVELCNHFHNRYQS